MVPILPGAARARSRLWDTIFLAAAAATKLIMDPPIHSEPGSATPPHTTDSIAMTTIVDSASKFAPTTEPATQTTRIPAAKPVNLSPRMLVLVGLPGSGKTSFSKQLCHVREDWRRVNQDEMSDRQTCEAYARKYLGQGLKVVVDHCNLDESQRKVWVQLAWRLDVPVDCIIFDTTQEVRVSCLTLYECSSRILAHKEHSADVIGTKGEETLSPFVSNFYPPSSVEGFERISRVYPCPTAEYNAAAINEVFALLDTQPKVEHKRKAESPDHDKLRGVLQALPTMSRRIVDDTVHEKVLSYLESHAAAGDGEQMVTWGALEVVK
ncbi:AAA domain-containing protein, partial [Endogone sp. FLAS-F59071]